MNFCELPTLRCPSVLDMVWGAQLIRVCLELSFFKRSESQGPPQVGLTRTVGPYSTFTAPLSYLFGGGFLSLNLYPRKML